METVQTTISPMQRLNNAHLYPSYVIRAYTASEGVTETSVILQRLIVKLSSPEPFSPPILGILVGHFNFSPSSSEPRPQKIRNQHQNNLFTPYLSANHFPNIPTHFLYIGFESPLHVILCPCRTFYSYIS